MVYSSVSNDYINMACVDVEAFSHIRGHLEV